MIHQEDSIIHHNAAQHDTTDIGLNVKGGIGQKEHQDHADSCKRHGKHHYKGISQRLIKRCQHHIYKHQRQHKAHQKLVKRFLLLFVISPKEHVEVSGHGHRL